MPAMAGRSLSARPGPTVSLPAFDRLAPPPPAAVIGDRIEALTAPGDVVLDLHGRGGWIARAALDRQRRAITLESTPLTRLLAEVVLRPPDLRHLDAAFQALSGSPRRDSSLKVWIGDRFATHCATCGRTLVLDELAWEPGGDADGPRPTIRHYSCTFCRDQRGGGEHRQAPPEPADLALAADPMEEDALEARRMISDRFPVLEGGGGLVEDLLDLHTPRQLAGLAAILERIEADLRSAPVEAALRLAFLHAILPASRLHERPGRVAALRVQGGRLRPPSGPWRERNPWLAFEDGYRTIRAFLQRLESGSTGPLQARFGEDLRALIDGTAMVSVRVATASVYRGLAAEARDAAAFATRPGARLAISQPPQRPSVDRIAFAYLSAGWVLGREAAALLPLEALFGGAGRAPWGWQSAALTRSLAAAEQMIARDGRVVLVCDPGGEESAVAAVLGGVGAGYRVTEVRLAEPGEEAALVELVPPGAALPPGARTRANVALPPVPGGAGDPDVLPSRGLFAPPERFEARPFSEAEAARSVTEAAVEVLKARGEPARTERLFGEILVGLDRAGHLRRLTTGSSATVAGGAAAAGAGGAADAGASGAGSKTADTHSSRHQPAGQQPIDLPPLDPSALAAAMSPAPAGPAVELPALWERRPREDDAATGNVDRILSLIHDELGRPDQRRLVEIESGRWWLADRADQEAAAVPLADRVEWAVFSLLSTAGPLSESAFLERVAGLFSGHDLPDETLVRACLESYRSMASTPDRLVTGDDLLRRTTERAELLAVLAETGHRLGFAVWLNRREQDRPVHGHRLSEWLDRREQSVHLPLVSRAPAEVLEEVDAIWYVRGKATFLFEVEWTAMLAEPVLRRHPRIAGDDHTIRFLVIAPERTELVRHKLDRSPLLRAALIRDGWHILKSNHLRTFAALDEPSLEALEPFLGLDPVIERGGEQLPLFEG